MMLPCIAAIAIAGFVGKQTFLSSAFDSNILLMADIEALTEDETTGGDWYLHYYPCIFPVLTESQVSFFKVKVGANVDISHLTQFFNHDASNGYGPCEKAEQITCNQATNQLLQQLQNF